LIRIVEWFSEQYVNTLHRARQYVTSIRYILRAHKTR